MSRPPSIVRFRPFAATLIVAMGLFSQAQAQAPSPTGDGGQPIAITSDNLEVRQQENLAIFSGNVDAVQGGTTLRSDILRVFYGAEGATGGAGGDIRRIEAEGNVVVISDQQTATGDEGIYEPATDTITLIGNVVLTEEGNVIRAGRLDYGLSTGVAVLVPESTAPEGRVRALFQPQSGNAASPAEDTSRTDG